MHLIPVRCRGTSHHVRVEAKVVTMCDHDEEAERVLHALNGKAPHCVAVVDRIRSFGHSLSPEEFDDWLCAGVSCLHQRRSWREAGARTPDDVMAWRVIGEGTPRSALQWVDAGVSSPGAVARWRADGVVTAEEAGKWAVVGVQSITELRRWRRKGIDADEALDWSRARIALDEIVGWRKARVFSGADALRWRTGGCRTPADVVGWRARGVTSADIAGWHEAGCRGPDDLDWWDSFGLLDEARQWRGVGGPEDVAKWRAVGVTDPKDARRWIELRGFVSVDEIPRWSSKIGTAEQKTARDAVPARVRNFRNRERVRIGLDSLHIGGVPDEQHKLSGRDPGRPAVEERYFYRADWRRVHPDHADLVSFLYCDANGELLPELDRWEWLPRRIPAEHVDLRVECGGGLHVLTAHRCGRGWRFVSPHDDLDGERTLMALGASAPRCASVAAAFRELAKQLPPDRAAAWAETGTVDPIQKHFMYQWKVNERSLSVKEAVRMESESVAPVRVGEVYEVYKIATAHCVDTLDALALHAECP